MTKKLFLILFLIILSNSVSAAIIHGSVYDLSLIKTKDVKLEIDTRPKQQYISKDGDYEFNVPVGDYTIRAEHYENGILESSAEEIISVTDAGQFVLDLLLFPAIDEDEELLAESDLIDPGYPKENDSNNTLLTMGLILVLLFLIGFFVLKKKKSDKQEEKIKEESKHYKEVGVTGANEKTKSDLDKIIKILTQEQGRMTQKDLRKNFPLSEAKVSLMISELEHAGKVKRIKKGRGNIIILNQ